jgi:hypothetical protein
MEAGNDVKAAFARWKAMLGDIRRDLSKVDGYWDHPVLRDYAHETLIAQLHALDALIQQMSQPTNEPYAPLVQIVTGYGTDDVYFVPVSSFAEFLRGTDKYGCCAFCKGDTWDDPNTFIGQWFKAHPHADTCPVCQGRPT